MKDSIVLWNLSDLQWGNRLVDKELFRKHIALIKSHPNHYVVFGGDNLDAVVAGDKRYQISSLDPEIYKTGWHYESILDRGIETFCEEVMPIKDRVIAVMSGNHEIAGNRLTQTNATRRIASILGVPDAGYSLGLGIKLINEHPKSKTITSVSYIIYIHHGSGSAQTKGGKVTRGIQKAQDWEGIDVHMRGHVHDPYEVPVIRGVLSWNSYRNRLRFLSKEIPVISSGSYLRARSEGTARIPTEPGYEEPFVSYSEMKEYSLVKLGMQGVELKMRPKVAIPVKPGNFS